MAQRSFDSGDSAAMHERKQAGLLSQATNYLRWYGSQEKDAGNVIAVYQIVREAERLRISNLKRASEDEVQAA